MFFGKKILLMLSVLALIFIGCSSGQLTDFEVGETAEGIDILQALQTAGLDTFADLIEQMGIVDELNGGGTVDLEVLGGVGGGPYTVFAPTDEAFAMIPEQTLDELLENEDDVEAIVKHHLVSGTDLGIGETVDTISGGPIEVIRDGDRIAFVDGSSVLRAINYEYGVIYVIDRVLLPDNQILIDEYGLDTIDWGNEEEIMIGEE